MAQRTVQVLGPFDRQLSASEITTSDGCHPDPPRKVPGVDGLHRQET
jgi:hypothetical protein